MHCRRLKYLVPYGLFALMAALNAMPLASAATARAPEAAAQGRTINELANGWRFRFGGDAAGVTDAGYDDRDWQSIDLPHTWNRLGEYRLAITTATDNRQGIGWYRLTFAAQKRLPGHRQFLQFDAVGNIADVWVNGTHVGQHRGAFARFRFDVTDQLKPGSNVIVVKADNSKPEPGSSTENVVPLGGDFFVHGGIYRGVSLIDADSAQIDLLDHGGPGIYVSTPVIDADHADVAVLARLRNLGAKARALSMAISIRDASGNIVASDELATKLGQSSSSELQRTLHLAHPHLWQGREDPYLYRVVVELRERNVVIDRVEQPLGIRSFHFDAGTGFVLNGKPTPLHGASRHQDRLDKGWALSPEDHATDMAIMAEMGVNTVRHAHYQHAQEWVDAADRTGMVVWAEVPFVHESSLTNAAPTAAVIENAKTQLVEMIREQYNHPSIMIWSVGNEVDIRPTQLGLDTPAQSLVMLEALNAQAKREDPTRVTAYADCCENAQAIKGSQVLSNVTDITGYNRYFGWYYGAPDEIGAALDTLHAKYPKMPAALSEYGAGGALSQHTDNPQGGPVNIFGRPHPEEYESWMHEQAWHVLESRHYLAAVWIWNMFDFASDLRQEGDAVYVNDKGMVSYDRKVKKDVFYFYKAQWSAEPVLHITGRRYIDRAYPIVDVRAYSNAGDATLSVNGEAHGSAPCVDRICVWKNVALRAGKNDVQVAASIGGKPLTDNVEWTAPEAALGIFIDAGTLTGLTADGHRFGSDNFFAGGSGKSLNTPTKPGATPVVNAKRVTGNADVSLYDAYREGAFKYEIPLPDGRWNVTLYFAEPDANLAATRTFDVNADGKSLLSKFNIAKAAGGALTSIERHFVVVVKNGRLTLDFVPAGGPAMISAIAITPT